MEETLAFEQCSNLIAVWTMVAMKEFHYKINLLLALNLDEKLCNFFFLCANEIAIFIFLNNFSCTTSWFISLQSIAKSLSLYITIGSLNIQAFALWKFHTFNLNLFDGKKKIKIFSTGKYKYFLFKFKIIM